MQLQFHNSNKRFRVASLGRQAGKSTMCVNELLRHAWEKPGTKYWFISPTYDQAKQQYRRTIGMLAPCWDVLAKRNQTELRLKLINQSEILFKSGEVGHNLRGDTLNGVIIDEVRDQPSELWQQIIRPMLTTTKGFAAFVSTPQGYDFFHDLHEKAGKDPEWESFTAPSTCNPAFTQSEYEQAKKELPEPIFRQEILAEFCDITSGKVYTYSETNELTQTPFTSEHPFINPALPILLACDYNISPMSWNIGQFHKGEFYFFDEIHLTNSHTPEASEVFVEKFKSYGVKASPQVTIIGDATGKAQQRAAGGKSDYYILFDTLRRNGITYRDLTPDSNPGIKDRVNTMNARLRSFDGQSKLFINPIYCPYLKKDLQRVVWKEGQMVLDPGKDRMLTHHSDAVGYAVCVLAPIQLRTSAGLKVITRTF